MALPYHEMAKNFENCTKRLNAIDAVFEAANVRDTKLADEYYGTYSKIAPRDKTCYKIIDATSFVDNMKAAASFKSKFDVKDIAEGLWTDLYDVQNTSSQEKKIVIQKIIETIETKYNGELVGGSSKKRASTHRRLKSRTATASAARRRNNRRRRTARK